MKIPTECTLHYSDSGLRCGSDAVEWFAWTDKHIGKHFNFACRCEQHKDVRRSFMTYIATFNSYDDAVAYQAMREL